MFLDKKEQAKEILLDLYRNRYVETVFNTFNEEKAKTGWTLKNGTWSPWYLNLRPIGHMPRLVNQIGRAMNLMINDEIPYLDVIIGIEMTGIPIATISGAIDNIGGCKFIPFAYTRPLPEKKVRIPEEAKKRLGAMSKDYKRWGSHNLIEGRLHSGDYICLVDDTVTDLGSKLIAREIINYEAKRLGLEDITCNEIAILLDREQGAEEAAKKEGMTLHSLIRFGNNLGWLEGIMKPKEYRYIRDFQENPEKYQNEAVQKEVLKVASSLRVG